MCGIVAYTGMRPAARVLIDGLKRLEYRGYDSSGIAVCSGSDVQCVKSIGKVKALEDAVRNSVPELLDAAGYGIAHTRWATHGEPSDINAHPHCDSKGEFYIVHNGIIDNYQALRKRLEEQGCVFRSSTDSEVIAHLIAKLYQGDLVQAVAAAVRKLSGTYGIAVVSSRHPGMIAAARKGSPLVIGLGTNENIAASDLAAILPYTRQVMYLNDGDIAAITADTVEVRNIENVPLEREVTRIEWDADAVEKGSYPHFMLKEIFEQPAAFAATVNQHITGGKLSFENLPLSKDEIGKLDRIVITACGSAYHTGIVGKYIFESLTRIPTEVDIASEFRYRDPILTENTLVIIISQSGETADTLAALRLAKEKGARVLSIVNVVGSTIANESDGVIYTAAGPEIAVATTKAYSTQLAVLYLLCGHFAFERGLMDADGLSRYLLELQSIPKKINEVLEANRERAKELAKLFVPLDHAYYIGRGLDFAAATEGSLKMKEISYIHSEAYAAGELKHGTISLVEKGTLIVALACHEPLFAKTMSNIREVVSRGARILAVTTDRHKDEMKDFDFVLTVPEALLPFCASLEVVVLQLLAYYASLYRGCDIDKPRNLAKSVTVE